MTQLTPESDLATAIVAVYQAPFEEFVSRRDSLAKQLRAEKRRDDAALVKALQKPSRMAWALNHVVGEDPDSISRLEAAITDAQTGVDLRMALETVKEAVRGVAAVGARIAVRAGHPIEPTTIGTAVHAIIGDASAFADFRGGRLVEVPEGGGLNLLSALSISAAPERTTPPPPTASPPTAAPRAVEPPKEDPRIALAASARAELHHAERLLGAAREELEQARSSVRDNEARLEAAEAALLRAQTELEARRRDEEHSRRKADSAKAKLDEAQRAFDNAQARIAELE